MSVFTLADIRNVIVEGKIDLVISVIAVAIAVGFMALAKVRYERKELV